jgi:hypothetical protein
MKKLYMLLLAATICSQPTLLGQQTPQLEIIPYKDGSAGTLRWYEQRSNGRNYVGFSASTSIASNCTYRISDTVFVPCASDQVVLGASGLRFSNFYGRGIDLTSSSTPTTAQFYVRRFANAGIISAVDNGSAEMELTVSNNGVEKFFVGESALRLGVTADTLAVRPLTTSTYSLGSNTRRWTNFFTDNATITTGIRIGTSSTAGWVLTTDASGNGAWAAPSSGSTLPVVDTQTITKNAADNTKLMRFSNALISTATTRVLTIQDADITVAGIDLQQTWTATQLMQQVRPSVGSTYSLGTTGARWTNFFTDRITMSDSAGLGAASNFVPSATYTYNLGNSSYYWNGYYGRFINLQSQSGASPAAINIRDSAAALLFTMSDTGIGAGDFRVYDGGAAKFEVYSGVTNIATANLNITGTTTHTGSIQFDADATRNIGASGTRANQVWMSQSRATAYYYNGTIGATGTITAGTCVMTFTAGGLTGTSGFC